MTAQDINLIALIILGMVALAAIVAFAYAKRKGDDTLIQALATYQPLAEGILGRLDTVLAGYGSVLKPVHEVADAASGLIDQDTDTLVQALPPSIISALRVVMGYAQTLTDGQAVTQAGEVVPVQEVNVGGAPE